MKSMGFWKDALVTTAGNVVAGPVGGAVAYAVWKYVLEEEFENETVRIENFGKDAAKIYCYIACLGKLAKINGNVKWQEISLLLSILSDEYKLEKSDCEKLFAIFIDAGNDEASFDFYVQTYAHLIDNDYNQSYNFAKSLMAFAHADNDFSSKEQQAIKEAIKILRLPDNTFYQILYEVNVEEELKKLKVRNFGSGYFINDHGFIITNNHVINNNKTIKIRLLDDIKNAEIILHDQEFDLCLLKVDHNSIGARFYNGPIRIGNSIITYGYPQPQYQGFSPKLTKGVISATSGYRDDAKSIQFDAAIQPGNSGGPVIDCEKGGVIGIVAKTLQKSQNVNYAICSEIVLRFLDKINVIRRSIKFVKDSRLTFDEIIDQINPSIVQIIACK